MNMRNVPRMMAGLISRIIGSTILALLVAGLASAEPSSSHVKRNPVVGIMGLPEETQDIAALIEKPVIEQHGSFRFVSGVLNGKKVVLAQVGYGKVSSAAGTAILLNRYDVDCVIFSGTAGALNPDYIQGDVIVADDLAQHDLGQVTKDGFVQWLGSVPTERTDVPKWLSPPDSLLEVVREAVRGIALTKADMSPGARAPKVWEGVIVSGDSFISDAGKSAELRRRFGADAVEMEGASVAQVCYQAGVPCVVIRSMTDRADGTAFLSYQQFVKIASRNSAEVVSAVLGRLTGECLPAKEAPKSKQMWCLISGLSFATGSPYETRFAATTELSDAQKERVFRPMIDKALQVALQLVPARRVGVTFQPGANGAGPVSSSVQVVVEGTREQARAIAAILGYLEQRSMVMGVTEAGPFERRALLVENDRPSGWSNIEALRSQWPELARQAPAAAPGFSRMRTPLSDGLLIIDRQGNWSLADWYDAQEQIKKAAAASELKLRVTRVSTAYFEVQNSWVNGAIGESSLENLQWMVGQRGIDKLKQANGEIENAVAEMLKPKVKEKKQ